MSLRVLVAHVSLRRRRLLAAGSVLLALALPPSPPARAEETVLAPAVSLPAARDPAEFLSALEAEVPAIGLAVTRQDAIAQELHARSQTLTPEAAARTAQALCREASAVGYDPLFFLAVIHVESSYDHLAVSHAGAEGLMQLMPPTAAWMAQRMNVPWGASASFDPEVNVRLGVRYLVYLHRKFARLDDALTAYNRGPTATRGLIARFGEVPASVDRTYSTKVLARYARLRQSYGSLPLGGA